MLTASDWSPSSAFEITISLSESYNDSLVSERDRADDLASCMYLIFFFHNVVVIAFFFLCIHRFLFVKVSARQFISSKLIRNKLAWEFSFV
jgi:hypothetical protein